MTLRVPVILCCLLLVIDSTFANEEKRLEYHAVRGRASGSTPSVVVFEGEVELNHAANARTQKMSHFGRGWSGDAQLLWQGHVGESLSTKLRVRQSGEYRVTMQLTKAPDYGAFTIWLDDRVLRKNVDLYDTKVRRADVLDLGAVVLDGREEHTLRFQLTHANPEATPFRENRYLLGVDYLKLELTEAVESDTAPVVEQEEIARRDVQPIHFAQFKTLLNQHCLQCHGEGDTIEGDVDLRTLQRRDDFVKNIDFTQRALHAIAYQAMPPTDAPQPSSLERQRMVAHLDSIVEDYIQTSGSLQPIVMRRLNRYEYNNALRDLLQLKGDIYPLPEKVLRADVPYFNPATGSFPDVISVGNRTLGKNQIEKPILSEVTPFAIDLQSEHGFNNRGRELSISPLLLESFLTLAQSVVNSPQFDDYCGVNSTLFGEPTNSSKDKVLEAARERIRSFMYRAFRSPPDEETVGRYVRFFEVEFQRTDSFSLSMKRVIAAVLSSLNFLYLTEQNDETDRARAISAYELATRLSFFLWSSVPDDELLEVAENGSLSEPAVLQLQIKRMLEDRRSQSLSENFARQWLRLDRLITAVPDFDRFPQYYSRIGCEQWKFGLQMMVEPLLLFESIMVEDRSIMLLVDSDYAYRSDELQSWYHDTAPFGNRPNRDRFNTFQQVFRRRALDSRRHGGVITTSAVMTMTSSPLRTSPITRGAWVATVIFNQPPPPPPDVVPEIEADDNAIEAQGLTLRQRLKQHQENQSCVSCHKQIDPLGFALENFDAVGRWRDTYRSGLPIDASGKLFGQAEFADVVQLKDAMLDHPEWFTKAFVQHLLSYALGRKLEVADKPAVDRIVRNVMRDRGRFTTVVLEIATSYPFLHKSS